MKKLAIIVTHPIQYYAPLFKELANNIDVKVFYTWGKESTKKFDPGFGKEIEWDVPLLEGYEFEFLKNTAKEPGSHHFWGVVNPEAINKIKEFKADAILVFGWAYSSHLKIMRHFKGKVKVWFRGDSTLLDQQKNWKNLIRNFLLSWVYTNVDKAFYVGAANKEYFKKYGLKKSQLIFAPHAIDNNRFGSDRQKEAEKVRSELGIPECAVVVLFAGKLEPKKDPGLLLEAFAAINNKNAFLLFVGDGRLEKDLKAKSEMMNLQNVRFLPFQNQQQMPVIYQSCDIFCLPSLGPGETWGLAVNEAMAAGKAVIVSNKVGCSLNLVKNGVNGFVFKAGNLKEITEKLRLMIKSPLLTEWGKRSKTMVSNWNLKIVAEAIFNELRNFENGG